MVEKKIDEEIFIIYNGNLSKTKKIKSYLFNTTILASIFLFILVLEVYFYIYLSKSNFTTIASLTATSLLTLILLIIREKYKSLNERNEVLLAFIYELKRNWINLKETYNFLIEDIDSINANIIRIDPLIHVQMNIYELILHNFYKELIFMDLNIVEEYISTSNGINDVIKTREKMILYKHDNYNEILLNLDETLLELIKNALNSIIKLLGINGNVIKLDNNKIKELVESGELNKFSKKLGEDKLKNTIQTFYEKKISLLTIFDFKEKL